MPIFWLTSVDVAAAGGSPTSSPRQSMSIEIAASWPCATAQMMFFGPNAASPPKNTFGWVDCMVVGVDHRHVPSVELDADIALDPGKGVFLADGDQHVVAGEMLVRLAGRAPGRGGPWRRSPRSTFSNVMPVSRPSSWVKAFGTR